VKSDHRLYGLDVIRSIAIILVLLSHGRHLFVSLIPELDGFFVLGYLGVELFFVLSGFLIGGILINITTTSAAFSDIKNFWVRRWFRTLPNYYLFLAIEILIAIFVTNMEIIDKIWRYLTFTQTFIVPTRPTVFSVSWSLAVEEWFYLVVPLLLLLAVRITRSQIIACLVVICLGIIAPLAVRVLFVQQYDAPWGPDIRNATVMRLDAIMFGFIGAFLFHYFHGQWEKFSRPLFFLGIILVTFNAIYVQSVDLDADWYARTLQFSVVPLGFLCIFPWARTIQASPALLPTITKISVWSYSLYLCHMLVLRFALNGQEWIEKSLIKKTSVGMHEFLGWGLAIVSFIAFVSVSAAISAAVYRYFEVPVMRQRDRISHKEKHTV